MALELHRQDRFNPYFYKLLLLIACSGLKVSTDKTITYSLLLQTLAVVLL